MRNVRLDRKTAGCMAKRVLGDGLWKAETLEEKKICKFTLTANRQIFHHLVSFFELLLLETEETRGGLCVGCGFREKER